MIGTIRIAEVQIAQTARTAAHVRQLLVVVLVVVGCSGPEEDIHEPGQHGGIIVSVGVDHYHAEALFVDNEMRLYMLGQDETHVIEVEKQQLHAILRPFGDAQAKEVLLEPRPQAGDREGMTSLFAGEMPANLPPKQLLVVVPSIRIDGTRYRFSFTSDEPVMPAKVTNDAERELYLTPGGIYTESDIEANGRLTASEKFAGFVSAHDPHPQPGDRVCPITGTLANPQCTWIIGGEEYQFCCPPCVDEFVKRAKESPESIQPVDTYFKK